MLGQFSLVKEERDLLQLSLTDSLEALTFQRMATFNIYRIAWAQGSQVLNYREIIKEKDFQFSLCEKQRKKSFFRGFWKGALVGAGITVVIFFLRGKQ